MPAPSDIYKEYLRLALPFNQEWKFFDAASYIKQDGSTQNPHVKDGNVSISNSINKFYSSSAYFDGVGDSVIYNSPGKLEGDFCVEFWYYATDTSGTRNFITWGDGSWKNLRNTGGNWNIETASNNGSISVSGNIVANAWTHFAVTRSGSSVRFFSNGIQIGFTQTTTATWGTNEAFRIGRRTAQTSEDFKGYIQDFRMYDGVPKYTANFTPPSEIVDQTGDTTGNNFLVLAMPLNNDHQMADVANKIKGYGASRPILYDASAAISATVSKFYTRSLYIPGSSGSNPVNPSRLRARTNEDFRFGTGDFTIEAWIYADPGNYGGKLMDMRGNTSTPLVASFGGTTLSWSLNGTAYDSVITRNTWQHVALTRQNGTVRAFLNGTQTATGTNTYDMEAPPAGFIGIGNNSNTPDNAYSLNGYIQDFRVYKDYAKYTGAFTPHTTGISPSVSMPTATNMKFIDSFKVNSYGFDRVVLSGIAQDFTNLILKYSLKTTATGQVETLNFRINGDQGNRYFTDVKYGEGSGFGTFTPYNAGSAGHAGYCTQSANSRYDVFSTAEMIIFGYSSAANGKNVLVDSHYVASDPVSSTTYQSAVQGINDGGWKSTDPVVNIEIFNITGTNFLPGSTFYLYGIK